MSTRTLVLALFSMGLAIPLSTARAAFQTWHVQEGSVTLSLHAGHLETLGFEVVGSRSTAERPDLARIREAALHSFGLDAAGIAFRTENGRVVEFEAEPAISGGLAVRATHPRTGSPLTPALLYDFGLAFDPAGELEVARLLARDGSAPFAVQSADLAFSWSTGHLSISMGDLVVTREWAERLQQPALAGQWVGTFDLRATATPASGEAIAPERPERPGQRGAVPFLDVTLGELYGLTSQGRMGSYPNGWSGLAAATTSCNSGNVDVPWNAPMEETHPTIGLALFRLDANGILEQIGINYLKHGFYALSSNQCNLGCDPSDGTYLGIGCSDTYSAGHNGDRYNLGPRSEVNPFTGVWTACGSYFDDWNTPDADCARDYFGNEPNSVAHRIEVHDSDLGNPGATYYYEGEYVVRDDGDPDNSIGWRECTMSWSGSNWSFNTVGGGLTPNYGPLIYTWGDEQVTKEVSDGDGTVVLATQVTDLGGGQWHYEYALYNWSSDRGIYSFTVPVGAAALSNIGFHDIDQNADNDWTVDHSGGFLTWSTDDYATDPDAHALFFQTMFNFRFDANVGPEGGDVALGIFKPGTGSTRVLPVQIPGSTATSVIAGAGIAQDLALSTEPNPFSESTVVRFALDRSREARLSVLDVSGRVVQVLFHGEALAGESSVRWNGRDANGSRLASGVYFFRLEAGEESKTLKTTLLR